MGGGATLFLGLSNLLSNDEIEKLNAILSDCDDFRLNRAIKNLEDVSTAEPRFVNANLNNIGTWQGTALMRVEELERKGKLRSEDKDFLANYVANLHAKINNRVGPEG